MEFFDHCLVLSFFVFTDRLPLPLQYVEIARSLAGYGEVLFPHCPCDSRKEGHVVAVVSIRSFKLQATREDGTLEVCSRGFSCLHKIKIFPPPVKESPEGGVEREEEGGLRERVEKGL